MLTFRPEGLYCESGDIYIDPIRPVQTAIITHGHADHARWGMAHYIATPETCEIMKKRIGETISITPLPVYQPYQIGDVTITFIPAGHILGSAQVLIDNGSERALITGDFNTIPDPTVADFDTVSADLLVMETTFALPIYQWPSTEDVFSDIHSFWASNASDGYHTVLYAYSLGKAQRLLHHLDASQGPIAVHGAVANMNKIYQSYDRLKSTFPTLSKALISEWDSKGLIVAPPATIGSSWLKKLGQYREAYVSGWMLGKGQSRRRNMRGFVLSDHADWNSLIRTVDLVSPKHVWTMHGYTDIFARYLNDIGVSATPLSKLQIERSE